MSVFYSQEKKLRWLRYVIRRIKTEASNTVAIEIIYKRESQKSG